MDASPQETAPHCPYPALPPPADVPMATPPAHPCPYLPNRQATLRAFFAPQIPPRLYHRFLDAGFRRAGQVIYQPICRGCRLCLPIRIPVAKFAPGKSLRRCARHNSDLDINIAPPILTTEKQNLYDRYLTQRHNKPDQDPGSLEEFLYTSPVDTIEFTYRLAGRLLAVGICDICPDSLSSVYFFFDPADSPRGLGNFGALTEINFARAHNIPYWYLGYWVKGCKTMDYKATYKPHELLHPDGIWRAG